MSRISSQVQARFRALRAATVVVAALLFTGPIFVGAIGQPTSDPATPPASGATSFCDANVGGATGVCTDKDPGGGGITILGSNSIFQNIVDIIVMLVGIFSVIMIIIGGFRYVTSGGDANNTKGAKDTILYAVVGLVIAIFTHFIVALVLSLLA